MFEFCYGKYAYLFEEKRELGGNEIDSNERAAILPNQNITLVDKTYNLDLAKWLVARRTKYALLIIWQLVLIIVQCNDASNIKSGVNSSADKLIIISAFMIIADFIQLALYTAALYFWNDLQKTLTIGNANLIFVLFAKMTFLLVPYFYIFGPIIGFQIYLYLFPYFFANITIFRIMKNSLLSYFKNRLVNHDLIKKLYYITLLIYVPILLASFGVIFGLFPVYGVFIALIFELIYAFSSTITKGYYGESKIKRAIEIVSETLFYLMFIIIFYYMGILKFIIIRVIISLSRVIHVKLLLGDFIVKHFGVACEIQSENLSENEMHNDREMREIRVR